jgi:periplasmic protein TonB
MIKRYITCTPPGVMVTAALLLLMQQLINTGEDALLAEPVDRHPVFPSSRVPPPPPPLPRDEPPAPIPPPVPVPGGRPLLPKDIPVTETTFPQPPAPDPMERPGHEDLVWSDSALVSMVRVEPVYPLRAIELGLEGSVLLRFDVGPDGLVSNPEILQSSHPLFNAAALRAAGKFRYKPRVVDGTAVATPGVQTVFRFTLDQQTARR